MSTIDRVKQLVQKAKDEGRLTEKIKMLPELEEHLFQQIWDGYKPAPAAPRLIGCTDAELQSLFSDKRASSVRWARWQLAKAGFIERSGIRRAIAPGQPKMMVWIAKRHEITVSKQLDVEEAREHSR